MKIAPLFVLLLLIPQAAPATELSLGDLVRPENAVLASSDTSRPGRLAAEYRLYAEGLGHQQLGDLAVELAQQAVEGMQALGWALVAENRQRRGGEFGFRKAVIHDARLSVAVAGQPREGRMQSYVLLRYEATRRLPFSDLTGIDAPDVPRYPGSVRVRWMNLLGDFAAKYLVVDSVDAVRTFFAAELPGLGWQPGDGPATLNYRKGGKTAAEAVADERGRPLDPQRLAAGLIPTTLSVALRNDEGIVEIGIGRAVGAGGTFDSAKQPITPPRPSAEGDSEPLVTLDPDRDLPVYPGLERLSRRGMPSNPPGKELIRLSYAKEGAPMEEALAMAEFYLEEMKRRGWQLEDDEWYGIGRELEYRKDALRAHVSIKAVGRYPLPDRRPEIRIPVEVLVTLSIPTRDVAGRDIPDVPRYPGSVRFYHLQVATDELVKYKAVASGEEAEWFFIDQLPRHGWSFAGNDRTGLLFVPAGSAGSASEALASGQLIPTTLKIKVDDERNGAVMVGMDLTRGD